MPNKRTQQKERRSQAMPEVRALVRKFGLAVIGGCVTRIREYERENKKLVALEKEIAERRKRISE